MGMWSDALLPHWPCGWQLGRASAPAAAHEGAADGSVQPPAPLPTDKLF